MFNFTTVVFDGTSPTFISQTLRDGTPQVVNNSLSLVNGFKTGILCSLKTVHLYQNVSELCLQYSYVQSRMLQRTILQWTNATVNSFYQ